MKTKLKYLLFGFFSLSTLGSCTSDEAEGPSGISERDDNSVFVACQPIQIASGSRANNTDTEDPAPPIKYEGFDENSLIYISQKGTVEDPNFSDSPGSSNLYIYKYSPKANVTWEKGYNFTLKEGNEGIKNEGIKWDYISSLGPVRNAFSFYAFHFPIDNIIRWGVETDQTGGGEGEKQYDKSNFIKSDIMGAIHATSALYTRLRFRLFHLMTYLKVTVYVPVFNGSSTDDYQDLNYSGFIKGAFQGAYVMNAYTDLSVSWSAIRSSDTEAPLVEPNPNKTGPKSNIKMYRHQTDEETINEIDIDKYYPDPDKVDGIEDGKDKVRAYHFSVLFPAQEFGDNFLCFALRAPDEQMKYYYFSRSQIKGETGENRDYGLTQGTLQRLYLYLPRKTNETILVGAEILPWNDAATDMTVNKQPTNPDVQD